MGSGAAHRHDRPSWGEPRTGGVRRLLDRLGRFLGSGTPSADGRLRDLPLALQTGELAQSYLAAERDGDHRRAGAAAVSSMERALADRDAWRADIWAHRALWHFEQAGMALQSIRQARRIGDLRLAAGDPGTARRYYAEAVDEARDIGAEHEQGLASLGLGHALLELGDVTAARRIAGAAETLLSRAGAPLAEIEDASRLRGSEIPVNETKEVR